MDTDLVLVLGIALAGFAIPSLVSAYSERRPPRVGAVLLVLGVVLIGAAILTKPGGYTLSMLPDAFFGVIARFIP